MKRIALVGDRSPAVRAHTRIPDLFDVLRDEEDLDVYWVPTPDAEDPTALGGFDGIWLVPGSPYRSPEGGITAAQVARTGGIPFLGSCGGFQHALLEFARHECGFLTAGHSEYAEGEEEDADSLIVELACSLAGHAAAVEVTPGSLIERLLGASRTVERYHCSYGLAEAHVDLLAEHGMRFTGRDESGAVRAAELPDHPFYLLTLFQPELAGDGTDPHPIIRGFVAAAGAAQASRSLRTSMA
ncbi:CTP synthase C-terminal region-related (seleno)protein [Actinoplanes philippinensis]|uniref:CTP synthase C-terminal region-related (seleno)protein n=1 Tax=Actinoplanes philippinensis TaxID=35752 RepID=UPI0034079E5D